MTSTDGPDLASPPLAQQRWLVRVRWVAAGVLLVGALASALAFGWSGRHVGVLAVVAAIFIYNGLLTVVLRRHRADRSPGWIAGTAWTQILLDQAALTLMTLWTDGLAGPLPGLFVLHLIFASLLLPPRSAFTAAAAAVTMITIGLWITGQWPDDRAPRLAAAGWVLLLVLTAALTHQVNRTLREHERALRRQHRRTRAILETAADGIITIDERGVIESVNPAATRIFGYDADEMIGRNVAMLMPDPDRAQHDTYIADYLRTGQARIIGIGREVLGRRRDGTTFPLDLAVSEVRLGSRRSFTGLLRDVSDRKRAEDELRTLNKALRRQQRALLQSEKMAAMGQMAAGVAHEISNPLASMDSLIELMKRRPERIGPETADDLRTQVQRISRIVQQMTDFAHPNETAWETAKLNALVEDALEIVRFDHRLRRIHVQRRLDPDAGTVHVMPHAVEQVLVNLIMNAVDALQETSAPTLIIATRVAEDGQRVIEVIDNGHGISPEHLGRVFEPFFTTKPVGRGTGLGLSISYSLVRRHGGRCEVESRPGQGSTFRIVLPARADHDSSQPRDAAEKAFPDSETPSE